LFFSIKKIYFLSFKEKKVVGYNIGIPGEEELMVIDIDSPGRLRA
jgi:hypothetical protein